MHCDFVWDEECSRISKSEHDRDIKEDWYYPKYYSICANCDIRKKYCRCSEVSSRCRACQESSNTRF